MSEKNRLSVDPRFDRLLVRKHTSSVRYLVVDVKAPTSPENKCDKLPPLNLGVIIDASASMDQHDRGDVNGLDISRLDAAKNASEGIIKNLKEQDALSLTSFSDDAIAHFSSANMNNDEQRRACSIVREVSTRSVTDLYNGWMEGAEQVALKQENRADQINRLLILTDGHANRGITDPDELAKIAADLRERGIITSAVGIGEDYSTEQIEPLSEYGGGMLHHANNPSDIIEIVLSEILDMRASVIEDLKINVSLENTRFAETVKIEPIGLVSHENQVIIGNLVGDANKSAVFRIHIPKGCEERLEFNITAMWKDSEGKKSAAYTSELSPADDDAVFTEVWNQEVCSEAANIWQADIIQQALKFNKLGDARSARRFAVQQKSFFGHYTRRLDNGKQLFEQLEQALHRMARPMREINRKEIHMNLRRRRHGELDRRISSPPSEWSEYLQD